MEKGTSHRWMNVKATAYSMIYGHTDKLDIPTSCLTFLI